jgi:hypothetical protein
MDQMRHRIGAILRGSALPHDPAALHYEIAVGKTPGEIQILFDDQDRDIEFRPHAA